MVTSGSSIPRSSEPVTRPRYAEKFRCIGPACEDSCCSGWAVHFDKGAWDRCRSLPAGELRSKVEGSLVRIETAFGVPASALQYAQVKLTESGDCPFLDAERLCQIQVEQGRRRFRSRALRTRECGTGSMGNGSRR